MLIGLFGLRPTSHGQAIERFGGSEALSGGGECGVENNAFLDGEEVVYKVYYNLGFFWTEAGMVHFTVRETDSSYNITASGSTAGFYDNFYRVRDTFETHLDKSNLMPTYFMRNIEEGKYRKFNKFFFDHESKRITSYKGHSPTSKLEKSKVDFTNCMHDVISVVYSLRNTDIEHMKPGESFPVNIYLEEQFPLEVRVLETDEKKKVRGLGKFRANVVQPELIAGEVFKEDSYMTVYVSADSNRLPLIMESPLIVGKMKAVLYDFKGLKYDLDAKLD